MNVWKDMQEETQQVCAVICEIGIKLYSSMLDLIWQKGEAQLLRGELSRAGKWADWQKTARKLDYLEGKEAWKMREQSSLYDYRLIRKHLNMLRNARKFGEVEELVNILSISLTRNLGGCLSPKLYEYCLVGTKKLILDYQTEVQECLKYVLESPEYPLQSKLNFFANTGHAYGKSALLLSGGASLGMYHLGVVKFLYEHNLLPKIITGSSAGSLIAGIVCSTPWEGLSELFKKGAINCDSFSGLERGSWTRKIKRFFKEGHLMDVNVLKHFARVNIGDITFEEAYKKTGLILNITVVHSSSFDSYRLLNYLTAPHVLVWSAAVASSAVPYVFPPIELLCKNASGQIVPFYPSGLKFIDGSVKADLPKKSLAELFNVNSFIVSQTNPWVVPLLSEDGLDESVQVRTYKGLKQLIMIEFRHWVKVMAYLGVCDSIITFLGVFSQEFRGTVTIWPVPSVRNYACLLYTSDAADE